eukprot:6490949-Amphidinium_carterae.1
MRRASLLSLPYMLVEPLGEDLMQAVTFIADHHADIDQVRLNALSRLTRVCTALADRSRAYASARAGQAYRQMRLEYNVLAMKWIQHQTGIEDRAVPDLLLSGMPIVGMGLPSPFFADAPSPPAISLQHLLMGAPPRRVQLLQKVLNFRPQDIPALRAALAKTMIEVERHCMAGPYTEGDIGDMFGAHWNPCRRFALHQGHCADGSIKYRVIDDHTENDNNKSAERCQRIHMSGVSTLMLMVKALSRALAERGAPQQLHVATDDMQSAYRQIPVSDTNLSCCVVMVADPDAHIVRYFVLYGQPFGAAHAVEPSKSAPVAQQCVHQLFQLLGFRLDPTKSQPPTVNAVVLGVHFDLQYVSQGLLQVHAKPDRVRQLTEEMKSIIARGFLSPSHAAKLVGKADFVNSTLFGR